MLSNCVCVLGYVKGFARRFWQGNETHRGVPGRPGRVATIVEEREAITHGVALELKGNEALEYLNNRQVKLTFRFAIITFKDHIYLFTQNFSDK